MAQEIKNFRLPNGHVACIGMWRQQPRFSTIEWAATATPNLRAFTYTQGQRVPSTGLASRNATELDTNMVTRARQGGRMFLAYGITYEIFAAAGSDAHQDAGDTIFYAAAPAFSGLNLRKLQRRLLVEVILGTNTDRPDLRLPFSQIGQGIGAVAVSPGESNATTALDYGTAGHPVPSSQTLWDDPLMVPGDKVLQVRVKDLAHSGLDAITQSPVLRLYLDGLESFD